WQYDDSTPTNYRFLRAGDGTCVPPVVPPPPPAPLCTLTASPSSVTSGGTSMLSWTTTHADTFSIDQGIGTTTPVASGSTTTPAITADTTFTGTVTSASGTTATCQASVTISSSGGGCTSNCGGGGGGGSSTPAPTVTLFSYPSVQPLAAYLYLSQIPYTGLDLGPVGTVLYWLALIGWSLALAYLVLFGGLPYLRRRFGDFGGRVALALNTPALAAPLAAPSIPSILPVIAVASKPAYTPAMSTGGYSSYEGFKSFAREGALSIDDIVKGLSQVPSDFRPFAVQKAPVAAPYTEPIYENVEPIYDRVEPIREEEHPESIPAPRMTAPVASRPTTPVASAMSVNVSAFLEALLAAPPAGGREVTFSMLRIEARSGGDTEAFLTQVACALDDAYRARLEGIPVHPEIARITAAIATPVLERLVTAFASAIDSPYSVGITGAKLALTRALAISGA
ncbi:MAG: hypothetical protein Q8P36_01175, partial [bacterium]|nr:hypothetical protein [bacterium]